MIDVHKEIDDIMLKKYNFKLKIEYILKNFSERYEYMKPPDIYNNTIKPYNFSNKNPLTINK